MENYTPKLTKWGCYTTLDDLMNDEFVKSGNYKQFVEDTAVYLIDYSPIGMVNAYRNYVQSRVFACPAAMKTLAKCVFNCITDEFNRLHTSRADQLIENLEMVFGCMAMLDTYQYLEILPADSDKPADNQNSFTVRTVSYNLETDDLSYGAPRKFNIVTGLFDNKIIFKKISDIVDIMGV